MGKVKAIIGFGVLIAGIYVCWNMIPPYFHNYSFRDDLDEIARRVSYTPNKTDDEIRAQVIKQAGEDGVQLKEDEITLSRDGAGLGITVHYQVHVDMMVHPVDLDFTVSSLNKRI
jgi:uncharacterized protein DUF4845